MAARLIYCRCQGYLKIESDTFRAPEEPSPQSRAQSSPAPRSAVGRRGELWGHGIFTAEIGRFVRFRFLCACLGDEKRKSSKSSRSQLQPLYDRERRYFC